VRVDSCQVGFQIRPPNKALRWVQELRGGAAVQCVTRYENIGEGQVVQIGDVYPIRGTTRADVSTCKRKVEEEITSYNVCRVGREISKRFLPLNIPAFNYSILIVAR